MWTVWVGLGQDHRPSVTHKSPCSLENSPVVFSSAWSLGEPARSQRRGLGGDNAADTPSKSERDLLGYFGRPATWDPFKALSI